MCVRLWRGRWTLLLSIALLAGTLPVPAAATSSCVPATLYTGPNDRRTLSFQALGRLYGPRFSDNSKDLALTLEVDDTVPLNRGGGQSGSGSVSGYTSGATYPFTLSFNRLNGQTVWTVGSRAVASFNPALVGTTFEYLKVVAAGSVGSGGSVPSVRVSLSDLRVNSVPVGPSSLSADTDAEATRVFRAPLPCPTANVTGSVSFTWLSTTRPNAAPYLEVYLGNAKCDDPLMEYSPWTDGACTCPPDTTVRHTGSTSFCLCAETLKRPVGKPNSREYSCPVPEPQSCLRMPSLPIDTLVADIPAKASFNYSVLTDAGLGAVAGALADGLRWANFSYQNPLVASTCTVSCGTTGRCNASVDGLLSGMAIYQGPAVFPPKGMADMAAVWFDLLLPSQALVPCGFRPDAALSDAAFSIYRNTLCGTFAYEECFEQNYSSISVPLTAHTCFDIQVSIPTLMSSTSSDALLVTDGVKVGLVAGTNTDCVKGPQADGGWDTELTFKTIVQFPYAVESISIISADPVPTYALRTPVVITSNGSNGCSASQYKWFEGDALDVSLQANSYCLQTFVFGGGLAAVGSSDVTSGGFCAGDADVFYVTVTSRCQSDVAGASVACPSARLMSRVTTLSVPKVCMQVVPRTSSSFTTRLDLSQDSGGRYPASTYTPNSLLCGHLTITASLVKSREILQHFRVDRVALGYGRAAPSHISRFTYVTSQATDDGVWVGRFCFVLNETNVPGLFSDKGNDQLLGGKSQPGSIGIYRRAYTVAATAVFDLPRSRQLGQEGEEGAPDAPLGSAVNSDARFEFLRTVFGQEENDRWQGDMAVVMQPAPKEADTSFKSCRGSVQVWMAMGLSALIGGLLAPLILTAARARTGVKAGIAAIPVQI